MQGFGVYKSGTKLYEGYWDRGDMHGYGRQYSTLKLSHYSWTGEKEYGIWEYGKLKRGITVSQAPKEEHKRVKLCSVTQNSLLRRYYEGELPGKFDQLVKEVNMERERLEREPLE